MAKAPKTRDETPRDPSKGAVTGLPIPRYVSLKGTEGNARRGPGLTHRIDWVFTREGMPLKITAEYEHWRRVEDADGAGGWIHYMLLSGVRSVLVTKDMAEAHSAPDEGSEVLFQNELNVVGRLVQCVPDWCRIMVEGEKGWLPKADLWGVKPDEIFP
nr:SH3 domain-containing protein [Stagnihabitans tardus]